MGAPAQLKATTKKVPDNSSRSGGSTDTKSIARYKLVSKISEVDEKLFGDNKKQSKKRKDESELYRFDPCTIKPGMLKVGEGWPKAPSRRRRSIEEEKEDTDTIIVTTGDIARIKESSIILTPEEIRKAKQLKEEERARVNAVSNARKEKMQKLEEERRKKSGDMSYTEKLKLEADTATMTNAMKEWEDTIDDVKRMNAMMTYSRCVTIRDKQKEDKASRIKEDRQERLELDAMMQADSNRKHEIRARIEAQKAHNRREGAKLILNQIAERAAQKKIEQEQKELDGQALVRHLQKLQEEDKEKARQKHEEGKKLLERVMRDNDEAIAFKKRRHVREREEMRRIEQYVVDRDKKLQAYLDELERIKKEKEEETIRLRKMQEKANDKQAELDALRAQRAYEQSERNWRAKEKKEAERVKNMMEDLVESRETQKMLKVKKLADLAKVEEKEFYRIIQHQKEAVARDKAKALALKELEMQQQRQIIDQIRRKKEKKVADYKEWVDEGVRLRAKLEIERQRLEVIKARKLKELEAEGVPLKYRADLARKKVNVC